ncbi:MAG: HNH endonuclease signature motif containing protein [Candidatus Thorarchaeota archaeon]|jgi:hypothetical protein
MTVSKPYNAGQWSEARFHSFIKSALRWASQKWGPRNAVKKQARLRRGVYLCKGYNKESHEIPASIKINNKRVNNAIVDHIDPVIDPITGFTSWDDTVDRMFCEEEGFQLLCYECSHNKTQDEREIRRNNK